MVRPIGFEFKNVWRSEKITPEARLLQNETVRKDTVGCVHIYLAVRVLRPMDPAATDMSEVFASCSQRSFASAPAVSPQSLATQSTMNFGNAIGNEEDSLVEIIPQKEQPEDTQPTATVCPPYITRYINNSKK